MPIEFFKPGDIYEAFVHAYNRRVEEAARLGTILPPARLWNELPPQDQQMYKDMAWQQNKQLEGTILTLFNRIICGERNTGEYQLIERP